MPSDMAANKYQGDAKCEERKIVKKQQMSWSGIIKYEPKIRPHI